MSGKRYSPEDIIRKLRHADVLLGQGTTVAEVNRQLSVNKITYYRWRKEYGGMKVDEKYGKITHHCRIVVKCLCVTRL